MYITRFDTQREAGERDPRVIPQNEITPKQKKINALRTDPTSGVAYFPFFLSQAVCHYDSHHGVVLVLQTRREGIDWNG